MSTSTSDRPNWIGTIAGARRPRVEREPEPLYEFVVTRTTRRGIPRSMDYYDQEEAARQLLAEAKKDVEAIIYASTAREAIEMYERATDDRARELRYSGLYRSDEPRIIGDVVITARLVGQVRPS